MGRLTSQIPNEDPDRLSRVMDAKYRMIGVRSSIAIQMSVPDCLPASRPRNQLEIVRSEGVEQALASQNIGAVACRCRSSEVAVVKEPACKTVSSAHVRVVDKQIVQVNVGALETQAQQRKEAEAAEEKRNLCVHTQL